ncbi:MAG: nuclear transport factor 2 family protein [Blastocatellales bacterium]
MSMNGNNQIGSNSSFNAVSGAGRRILLRGCAVCLSLLAILTLASFAASAQTPDPNVVNEIVALLNKHDQALNQKDVDALMSLYTPGDTTVLMGTGPGEKWVGKEEIKDAYTHFFQDFDKGSLAHDCFWKTGASKGDVAWLSAICKMSDSMKGKKREFGLNISAVFEKQGGTWLIRSMHFSNLTGPGTQSVADRRKGK